MRGAAGGRPVAPGRAPNPVGTAGTANMEGATCGIRLPAARWSASCPRTSRTSSRRSGRPGPVGLRHDPGPQRLPERRGRGLVDPRPPAQRPPAPAGVARRRGRPCRALSDAGRWRELCASLPRWLLSWWRGDSLPLAIDATPHGDRVTALVVSVLYRDSAIPVAWHILPLIRRAPGERRDTPPPGGPAASDPR